MLETLQKATPEDSPDIKFIAEALDKVKEILSELDKITGFEENKLSLETLNDMIVWKEKEDVMVRMPLLFRSFLFSRKNFKKKIRPCIFFKNLGSSIGRARKAASVFRRAHQERDRDRRAPGLLV